MGPVSRIPVILAGRRQLTDPVSRDPAGDAGLLIGRRWHWLAQTVVLQVVVSVLVVSVLVVSVLVSQRCYQPPHLVRRRH